MQFDFSKHTEVDSLDKVPQDFRGLYVAVEGEEGKFKLDSENEGVKSAVAAVTRLNNALTSERTGHEATKKLIVDLGPLVDFGATPGEIKEAFDAKLKEVQGRQGEALEVQVTKIKEDLAKEYGKKGEASEKRAEALRTQLYEIMVVGEAKAALSGSADSDVEAVDVDLALPHLLGSIKTVEKDGKFSVNVVDEAGDIRYSGATGSPMTVRERVLEMAADKKFGPLFKSEAPVGGGTQPGTTTRKPPMKPSEMTPAQKIAAGLRKGQHTKA